MTKQNTYRLRTIVGTLSAVLLVIAALTLGFVRSLNPTATAAASEYLNFQARLKNSSGAIVPDGNYNIEFKLYSAATSSGSAQGSCTGDSNCLWTETRTGANVVRVANGYFFVNLGSVTSLPSNIDWSERHWITMNIGGTGAPSWDGEMNPRLLLTAVPFAFKAGNVGSAGTSTVSTNSSNVVIQTGNATGATSNSGNVTVDTGTATGTAGTISIGASNASSLILGRSGLTTLNNGSLTVAQALNVTGLTTLSGGLTVETGDTFTFNGDAFTDLTGSGLVVSGNALSIDTTTTSGFFKNGGNAFTAASSLGNTGNYDLNVITNNLTRLTVTGAGNINVANNLTVGATLGLGSYTQGTLPTAATAGRIVRLSDGPLGLWMDQGSQWISLSGEVVNAKEFGAKGDGVTNDTAALNAAFTAGAGRSVYLPPGTYMHTGLTLPSQIYVYGHGESSVLKLMNASNTYSLARATANNGIRLENFTIDGNKANQTEGSSSRGVYLVDASRAIIKDLYIYNTEDHGIHLSQTGTQTGNIIEGNVISGAGKGNSSVGGSGIAISNSLNDTISNNTILDSWRAGVRFSGSGVVVSGNTIKGNGNGGIVPVSGQATDITITGNTIADNYQALGSAPTEHSGVRLVGIDNFVVTGNNIYRNGGSGVDVLNGSNNGVISGNICRANAQSGTGSGIRIYSTGSAPTHINVTGNRCFDDQGTKTQQYGLSIENNADDINYHGNMLEGNLTGDLNISTSGTDLVGTHQPTGDSYAISTRGVERLRVTGTGRVGIGTDAPDARLEIAGNETLNAWGINGVQLQATSGIFTDNSTAISGTVVNAAINSFGQSTLAAVNTGVTTTNAATVYIQGAPIAGTNQTITNAYAFWVDNGITRLDGNLVVDTNTLVVDAASDRVGIGTASPSALFSVGSSSGFQVDTTGNVRSAGYARIGSTTAPAATTAGSLTVDGYLTVGTNTASSATGRALRVEYTNTNTAAGADSTVAVTNNIQPAANSSTEHRAIYFKNVLNAATGVTYGTVQGGYFENRLYGDGLASTLTGVVGNGLVVDSSAAAAVQATTVRGFEGKVWMRTSGTSTGTVGTGVGFDANLVSSAGLTASNLIGFRMQNPTTVTSTNVIGLDIAALTQGTNIYGIRSQIASGANKYNLYVSGTADNVMAGNLRVGSTTAPTVALDVTGAAAISSTLTVSGTAQFNAQLNIGTADTTGTLLVLDTKTDTGDPTGTNGAMYYNSFSNKLRCYENGAWADCIGTGGTSHLTDAGAWTYFTSTSDEIVIGASTQMNTKLAVVNTTAANPIAIFRAAASQTGPLLVFQNSAGSQLMQLYRPTDGGLALGFNTGNTSNTYENIALGDYALQGATAFYNVAIGYGSLQNNNGQNNIAIGRSAASGNTGSFNVALGGGALSATGGGSNNIAIGHAAGDNITSGSNNLIIGYNLDAASATGDYQLNIAGLLHSTNYTNSNLTIGTVDITGQSLVLDTKTDAGDPTGVAGAMYYNSNLGKFRCYQGAAWADCITSPGGLFTDAGAHTYLTSTTDKLGIGSSSDPGAMFGVTNGATTTAIASFRDDTTEVFGIADGGAVTFKNATNALNAFQIQDASSTSLFNINTSATLNQVANGNIESSTNGWSAKGTATISISDTFAYFGSRSLRVVTGTSANNGASFRFPFAASTQYSLSFWARRDASSSTSWAVGRADNGTDTDCTTSPAIGTVGITTTWTNFTCTFTTGATIGPESNFYIKQTDTTTDTIYIDGVTLVTGATAQTFVAPANNVQVESNTSNITINASNTGEIQPWGSVNNSASLPDLSNFGYATANGYIYITGGYNEDVGDEDDEVYYARINADGSIGAWTASTNKLPQVRQAHTTVISNGYIYAISGVNASFALQTTVYYAKLSADGSMGTWATTSAVPNGRDAHSSVAYNGYIYNFGGGNANGIAYAKQNPDGTLSTWTETFSDTMPTAVDKNSAVVANGYVYLNGRYDGTNAFATVYYAKLNADGTWGTWQTNANALPAVRYNTTSAVVNGYMYVMGGGNSSEVVESTVYYAKLNADGSTGAWTTSGYALPAIRMDHGSVAVNGYIYTLAGATDDFGTSVDTVFYTSTSRVKVGGSLDLVGPGGGNLNEGNTGGSITAGSGIFVGDLQVQGAASFNQTLHIEGVVNAKGGLSVGVSDTTGQLLVLDTKTDAGDPAGINGGMYYNSNLGRFRCYQANAWADCTIGEALVKSTSNVFSADSTTFNNHPDLVFAMAANSTYRFEAVIVLDMGNTTADGKVTFTIPAGATITSQGIGPLTNTTNVICNIVASGQTCSLVITATYVSTVTFHGVITTGGTAGNLQFQFAQNTGATSVFQPIVRPGSTIKYIKTT